ncbi:hypothetical protein [Paenibacillus sp. NAIST15-1]|uniref:hypothetical protein n=1 Tax=Paenibacillus sp. NAIST15-1 TaxID=1605994 RepID=UPI000934F52B|nr:hypothetical protein [Paenibacillus sp. NAIST15-1]
MKLKVNFEHAVPAGTPIGAESRTTQEKTGLVADNANRGRFELSAELIFATPRRYDQINSIVPQHPVEISGTYLRWSEYVNVASTINNMKMTSIRREVGLFSGSILESFDLHKPLPGNLLHFLRLR